MSYSDTIQHEPLRNARSDAWVSFFLAIILVFPLFSLPGPAFTSGHPWKVELLSGLFVLILSASVYFTHKESFFQLFSLPDSNVSRILLLSSAFVLWSGLSVIWADSGLSVSHHTLTWAIYLIVFLIFLNRLRLDASSRSIIRPILLTMVIVGSICLIDYLMLADFGNAEGTLRIRYGKYAELLITVVPVLWAISAYSRKMATSAVFLAAGLTGWLTVMLSLSKGAFISGVTGFLILFAGGAFLSSRPFRPKILKLAALWIVFTLAVQVFFSVATAVPSTTEYISGNADPTRSTTSMRIFTWDVARQMASENWMIGVGADNFSLRFNRARASYAAASSADPHLSIAEDYIVERAHNEFLQIFAELGVVGLILIFTTVAFFLFWSLRALICHGFLLSPMFWGSFAGLTAFLISSLFSSFSFRAMQNGIAFFLVLALAANELVKLNRKLPSAGALNLEASGMKTWRPVIALSMAIALLMVFTSGERLISTIYSYLGERSTTAAERRQNYENAIFFYPENGAAYFSYGMRSAGAGDPKTGAFLLRRAIDHGLGTTVSYSLLAMLQEDRGDASGAEATMAEALSVFPRSVFARVRYAVILESNGNADEANKQMDLAMRQDNKEANGWYSLIKDGSTAAELRSGKDRDMTRPSELHPQSAVIYFTDDFRQTRQELNKVARNKP